jgi:hypothetical protein
MPLQALTLVVVILVLFFLVMRRVMAEDNFTECRIVDLQIALPF